MVLCILKRTHSVVREHILDDRLMVLCILAGARHSQDYARANARTRMRVCAPAYARMGIDVHAYRYIDISRIHAQTTCVCTDTYACVRVQGYRHIQPVYRGGQAPRRHAERLQHQKKKRKKKKKYRSKGTRTEQQGKNFGGKRHTTWCHGSRMPPVPSRSRSPSYFQITKTKIDKNLAPSLAQEPTIPSYPQSTHVTPPPLSNEVQSKYSSYKLNLLCLNRQGSF